MTPGRMPTMLAKPRATEDHKPTNGPVPTMALQARAFDSSENETLMPANTSSMTLGSEATSSSAAAAARGVRSGCATAPALGGGATEVPGEAPMNVELEFPGRNA